MARATAIPGKPAAAQVAADVARALNEDFGSGDATADLLAESAQAQARVIVRERAVLCGSDWFEACFRACDPQVRIAWQATDGAWMQADSIVCTVQGNARALVGAERCALNFLQTLSGTATTTAVYAQAVAGSRTRILDTRKTIPGLRIAQKYAVRCGGGCNHRMGLYDAILIKENHIAAAGSLAAAVAAARARHPDLLLEVEVESLDELDQALAAGVKRIMLDEFSRADLHAAVARAAGRAALEVSGGVELDALRELAAIGVDFISIGALTKHVRAIDFSMRIVFD